MRATNTALAEIIPNILTSCGAILALADLLEFLVGFVRIIVFVWFGNIVGKLTGIVADSND